MEILKHIIFNRSKALLVITASLTLSIALLAIRMQLNNSYLYLFLLWNLFLAVIPYAMSSYLVGLPKLTKPALVLWFGVWLLFLPNAPYMVTDFIHVGHHRSYTWWLDILLVGSFAFNGLLMFCISIKQMFTLIKQSFAFKYNRFIIPAILYLSAFGVYLGRFLRYNSWEILSNPKYLFIDIINIAIQPFSNKHAWLFTILFGSFLCFCYWFFKQSSNIFNEPIKNNE